MTPLLAFILMKLGSTYLGLLFKNLLVFSWRTAIGKTIGSLASKSLEVCVHLHLVNRLQKYSTFKVVALGKIHQKASGCNQLTDQLDASIKDNNLPLRLAQFLQDHSLVAAGVQEEATSNGNYSMVFRFHLCVRTENLFLSFLLRINRAQRQLRKLGISLLLF